MDIISDPSEIAPLAREWNELADRARTPLLRHEWFAAAAAAFCPPGALHCLLATSGGGVSAIAPLVLVRRKGWQQLEFLGSSYLGEPCGFLYRDEAALALLLEQMRGSRRLLALRRIGAESREVAELRIPRSSHFAPCARPAGGAPFLPITTSWSDYAATISGRHGYDLRRARRRAEGLGAVRFEMRAPTAGNLAPYLEELFRVEAAGWKGRQGSALLRDRRLRLFFHRYAQAAAGQGWLRLRFLRLGEQVVAGQLAVQAYNRIWLLKVGYDEEFAKFSPGILLMHETIRQAFAEGLEAVEFLGSDAPWLHIWTRQRHCYLNLHAYPRTLPGRLRFTLDRLLSGMKQILKRGGKRE